MRLTYRRDLCGVSFLPYLSRSWAAAAMRWACHSWRLYVAGVIPDNMWGSVPGRSTQEASFLYDMYLDDEDLEAFMASVDVTGGVPQHAA